MIIEIIRAHPRLSIIAISAVVSLFISLINYLVLDKEKVKSMKARQKELQKEMKEHKHNQAKIMELNKELLENTMITMKNSFKPMLITIIPVLAVFWWIRGGVFEETVIASTWLWYYIGSALVFSLIFRKIFKLP